MPRPQFIPVRFADELNELEIRRPSWSRQIAVPPIASRRSCRKRAITGDTVSVSGTGSRPVHNSGSIFSRPTISHRGQRGRREVAHFD